MKKSDKKNNDNNNILLMNKDEIFNEDEIISDSERENFNDDTLVDVFSYENLCLEYNFHTRQSAFYLKKAENCYELLYDCSYDENGSETSTYYSKDYVFFLRYDTEKKFTNTLTLIPKNDFIYGVYQLSNLDDKTLKGKFLSKLYNGYTLRASIPLIDNNEKTDYFYFHDYDYLNDYRKLFVKYKSAETLIPVTNILSALIDDLKNKDSKPDIKTISRRFSELHNFKEYCNNSIETISSFLANPDSANIDLICSKLQTNLNNSENLISMYLSDELNEPSLTENNEKSNNSNCNKNSNKDCEREKL